MKSWEARLQHVANAGAILTGGLFAWTKYLHSGPPDPYAPRAAMSPWEPAMHDAHVLVVPLLVYACGVLWRSHVLPQWRARNAASMPAFKKLSGLGLLVALVPMISTGHLIQVAVDESWRNAWVTVHLVTSVAWTASYGVHVMGVLRRRSTSSVVS